ncbi:flagellar hook-length control protein FliK [Methylophaga thalassica]|uniref:flagellar hook-length control protein FliK n=1 Tax=Methylophaga thalassica TaxID=40223 RepID=UPI002E7BBCD8|nr:flagellar hook-length control protein FliK [Methylophaga thalassica]WVI84821.1 flagellar hook-length control protein FliK [Methylophaga thalassica]
MQINRSQQANTEVIVNASTKLADAVPVGQKVEATVIGRVNAEQIKLQLGDKVFQVNTQQELTPGQKVTLQKSIEVGQPVIQLTPASAQKIDIEPMTLATLLKAGQVIAADVVKMLAQNRLLVAPKFITDGSVTQPQANQLAQLNNALPKLMEIDVSGINQLFKTGDKLAVEVLKTLPLSIKIMPDAATREQRVMNYQRELLPLLQNLIAKPASMNLSSDTTQSLPEPVRQALTGLIQNLVDKSSLQQPEKLQQTINNSGVFFENQLKQTTAETNLQQNLKGNLLRLADVLRAQLQSPLLPKLLDNPELIKQLPIEVQTAIRQVLSTPQDMRPLPAQILPALANRGQTPTQLLFSLLSGLTTASNTDKTAPPVTTSSPPVTTAPVVNVAANAQQAVTRAIEFQMMRDLLQDVESVTAKIQFNQLSMVQDNDLNTNANVWLFDLPVKEKQQLEMLQMRIDQQYTAKDKDKDSAIWQVQLNLETQNLGPMQARITLHALDVSVVLLAERQQSATLLTTYLEHLDGRLNDIGLNVSHLSCRQGIVKPVTPIVMTERKDHLVDISV